MLIERGKYRFRTHIFAGQTAEFFGTIDGVYLIALLQKILGVVAGTAAEIEDCSCGRELPEEFVLGGAEIGEASIGCEGVRVLIVII